MPFIAVRISEYGIQIVAQRDSWRVREFNRSFEDVLAQARKAGTVRADVDGTDVLDLLIGTATAVRRAQPRGSANQLITLVLDGLHTR
ncbi:SbtR family transcriptional regulator [Nocardia sp. NPDC004123]